VRKWIVIAVVVVLVAGSAIYVLSQRRKGSVEYHREAYFEAIAPPGKWFGFAPRIVRHAWLERRQGRASFHWEALLEKGYLTNREFVISNASAWSVRDAVYGRVDWVNSTDYTPMVHLVAAYTNVLRVTAPPKAMDKLGALIREADVPEKSAVR